MVEWPNGKQTRALTAAVILFSVVFGVIVAAFDYGLDKLFKEVIIK
jgi:preprotein translocase SecE subunit